MNTKPKEEASSSPRRLAWMLSGLGGLGMVFVLVWWPGCRQFPPVTSPEALQAMKLLYSACNTKDPIKLRRVEKQIEALQVEGKLSSAEQAAFARIIELANSGDWPTAEKAAFRFAQDQVGVGHP